MHALASHRDEVNRRQRRTPGCRSRRGNVGRREASRRASSRASLKVRLAAQLREFPGGTLIAPRCGNEGAPNCPIHSKKLQRRAMGTVKGREGDLEGLERCVQEADGRSTARWSALMKRVSMSTEAFGAPQNCTRPFAKSFCRTRKASSRAVYSGARPNTSGDPVTSRIRTAPRGKRARRGPSRRSTRWEFSGDEWAPAFEHLFRSGQAPRRRRRGGVLPQGAGDHSATLKQKRSRAATRGREENLRWLRSAEHGCPVPTRRRFLGLSAIALEAAACKQDPDPRASPLPPLPHDPVVPGAVPRRKLGSTGARGLRARPRRVSPRPRAATLEEAKPHRE